MCKDFLFYNQGCSICSNIAQIINYTSKEPIEVVPVRSPNAQTILKEFYPEGAPFAFYFIEKDDKHHFCNKGIKAAFRLGMFLPFGKKLTVLKLYFSYKAYKMKFNREEQFAQQQVNFGRRKFVRLLTLLPMMLILNKPSLFTSGINTQSNTSMFLVNMRSKIEAAVAEDVKMERPIRGVIKIDNPDCVTYPCICYSSYCCSCSSGVCVSYCQDGCNSLNYFQCGDSGGEICGCTSDRDCLGCASCLCYDQ